MKKQQKKAFTLVELLVVIAILAILASVAVVGYTAFIKNAAVSNDDNVVAQMNRYLEALKADDQDLEITRDNIWEVTQKILDETGMENLEPYSLKYGNHIIYDFKNNRFDVGKINGADNTVEVLKNAIFGRSVIAADEDVTPGFFGDCFLADTTGSALAEAVRGFYTFDLEVKSTDDEYTEKVIEAFEKFREAVEQAKEEESVDYSSILEKRGVLIDKYYLHTGEGKDLADPIVHVGVTDHSNIKMSDKSEVKKDENTGTTKVTETTEPATATESPTFKVTKDTTYNFDDTSKILSGSFNVVVSEGATLTLNFEVEDVESFKKVASTAFTNKNENIVIVVNGVQYEFASDDKSELNPADGEEGESISLSYKNPLKSFDIKAVAIENKVAGTDKEGFIAWDIKEFQLEITNEKGLTDDEPISTKEIVWSIPEKYQAYLEYDEKNEKFKFKNTDGLAPQIDEIEINATPKIGENGTKDGNKTTQTYKLKLVRIVSVSELYLDAKKVSSNMTLINEGKATKYSITNGAAGIQYNHKNATTIQCATDMSWTYSGSGVKGTSGTNEVEIEGSGKGTLTIKIGSYLIHTVNLTVANTKAFPIQVKSNNITVVGNGSPVLLSDLFVKKDAIPTGAEFVVFASGTYTGDTYMNPVRTQLQATSDTSKGLSVDKPTQTITADNFNTLSVQFTGTDANEIRIAIMQNGVRISEDVIVKVVDGYNVRNYADFTSKVNTENTAYPLTSNVVFLADIAMSDDVNFLQIPADKTLYGNGFKFDITKGRKQQEGIINLKGTLRDVMVVGAVYSTFAFSAGDDYGSSAVNATGNAYIYNSYIANTRSPLRTSGAGVVIEDSVLFGGRYSNIDMTGGTITIKGTVTTVQQVYSDKNVIGMGVSAWFNDSKKNVVIEEGANFVQYNFMDESIKQYLPKLALMGYDIMDLKEPFNAMFNDTATYGQYMITAANGNKYVNSGIISTDKYSLAYTIGGDEPGGFLGIGASYAKGAKKIVKTTTAVGDDEKFIIVHDTRLDPSVGTPISAGYVEVTGAQLKAGVEFVFNTKVSSNTNAVPYLFQVQSDDYLTINVTGGTYSALDYSFDKDMSSTLGLVESLSNSLSLHSRGIHYGKMCVGVNTPVSTAYAYGTTTYQQLLEQYIEMTDGDGTKDNFYAPENFQFVNGSVSNYWD